jgi:hypothetical protein
VTTASPAITTRSGVIRLFAGFALAIAAGLGASWALRLAAASAPLDQYLSRVGPDARFTAAGALLYDGQRFACGDYPTVLTTRLNDYGGAFFGFIVLNPKRFETLPLAVKRYAYAHECGHQYMGRSEDAADRFAILRGFAEGWLDARAMEEICDFIGLSGGDGAHDAGPKRCARMLSVIPKGGISVGVHRR